MPLSRSRSVSGCWRRITAADEATHSERAEVGSATDAGCILEAGCEAERRAAGAACLHILVERVEVLIVPNPALHAGRGRRGRLRGECIGLCHTCRAWQTGVSGWRGGAPVGRRHAPEALKKSCDGTVCSLLDEMCVQLRSSKPLARSTKALTRPQPFYGHEISPRSSRRELWVVM